MKPRQGAWPGNPRCPVPMCKINVFPQYVVLFTGDLAKKTMAQCQVLLAFDIMHMCQLLGANNKVALSTSTSGKHYHSLWHSLSACGSSDLFGYPCELGT